MLFTSNVMTKLTQLDQHIWEQYTKTIQPLKNSKPIPLGTVPSKIQITPRPSPHHTLDLHGETLARAHAAALAHVDPSKTTHKHVMIITGKSGLMSSHLPKWLDHLPHVRQVDTLEGGGAFRVWLKKPKNKSKL